MGPRNLLSTSKGKLVGFIFSGGWCYDMTVSGTIENCFQRSNTDLGSSLKYPAVAYSGGLLNRDQKKNPYFYNWNMAYVKYCKLNSF